MIRRFNYTGRKKIPRSKVPIRLVQTADGLLAFDASFLLDGLSLPANGRISIEAYRRNYFRRFSCGTIQNPRPVRTCVLEGLDPRALVLFRAKVSDPKGRLLAVADRIIPQRPEEETSDRLSLLPVDFVDLGKSVWRLDLASDWPSLQLNSRIDNIREIARSDPSFLSLVYPEVVRQILCKIIVEENHTDPETDPDDWMSRWLNFGAGLLKKKAWPPAGDTEPLRQEKLRWIDDVVEAFCESHQLLEKFIQSQRIGE